MGANAEVNRTMESVRSAGALLGRIMLAYIFVTGGIEKIFGPAETMQYMASGGLPHSLVPELFVLSVVVELLGGVMLIAGWHAALASLVIFHVSTGQTIEWEKNLAIMGGLLMVAVLGPGGLSLGGGRGRRRIA